MRTASFDIQTPLLHGIPRTGQQATTARFAQALCLGSAQDAAEDNTRPILAGEEHAIESQSPQTSLDGGVRERERTFCLQVFLVAAAAGGRQDE